MERNKYMLYKELCVEIPICDTDITGRNSVSVVLFQKMKKNPLPLDIFFPKRYKKLSTSKAMWPYTGLHRLFLCPGRSTAMTHMRRPDCQEVLR